MRRFFLMAVVPTLMMLSATRPLEAQEQEGSRFSVTLQGGVFQPTASGSVFDLARTELTLGQSDFRVLRVGVEAAVRVHPKVSVVGGWSTGDTEASSSMRNSSVYGTGTQTTVLSLDPALRGGLLVELSRFGAEERWTLSTLVGVGRQGYQFTQTGVFPDASTPGSTFSADLATEGTGDLYFGELRLTRTLTARLGAVASMGYQWSEAPVGGDYVGFDPISLSGLGISAGFSVRF
jgi:hypothetical protein